LVIESGFNSPEAGHELLLKKPLREEVFELLHRRIVAGNYPPGEWLRQEEISTQLGVSQTPVREALDLLVSVGLAERVPYRGVRVPDLAHDEMVNAYVLRLLLDCVAARMAAQNSTREQVDALKEIVAQTRDLVTLEDMSRQRQLNKHFHLSIAQASGNELLVKLYEMTSNLFPDWRLYEYMFRHPELLQPSLETEYEEHKAIADAIACRDADLAAQQVTRHIKNLGQELVDYLGISKELVAAKEEQVEPLLRAFAPPSKRKGK
jgi:DNA-binding GntR family transcriptional regulator